MVITLWMIVAWLRRMRRGLWVALLPAVFMTFVCTSFVFVSPQFVGMGATTAAYAAGAAVTLAISILMINRIRHDNESGFDA